MIYVVIMLVAIFRECLLSRKIKVCTAYTNYKDHIVTNVKSGSGYKHIIELTRYEIKCMIYIDLNKQLIVDSTHTKITFEKTYYMM